MPEIVIPLLMMFGAPTFVLTIMARPWRWFGKTKQIASPDAKVAIEQAESPAIRTNKQLVVVTNLVHSREVSKLPVQVRNVMSHVLAKLVELTASDAKKLDFDKQHIVDTVLFEHFPDTLNLYVDLPEKEQAEQTANVTEQFVKLYNALVTVQKSVITDATRKLEANKLYLEQKFGNDDTSQLSLTGTTTTQHLLETSATPEEPKRPTLSFAEKLRMAAMDAEVLHKKEVSQAMKSQKKLYYDAHDYHNDYCDETYGYKSHNKNYETSHEKYNRVAKALAMESEARQVHQAALRAEAKTRAMLEGKNLWK